MKDNTRRVILNVDGNGTRRGMVSRILGDQGFDVVETGRGEEALQLALQAPALMIIGIDLPDISGVEVCRRMNDNPVLASIPVFNIGDLGLPIRPAALIATVTALLQQSRPSQKVGENESSYRALFEYADAAVFIYEPHGRFLSVNQVACERLGYSRDELLQKSLQDIEVPPFGDLVSQRVATLLREGYVIFESAHVRRDGTIISVELSSRLINYGDQPAILSIARDITRLKRAELALQKQAEELARANRNLEQFIRAVSHDIQEPLRVIASFLQLLEKRCATMLDEKGKDYIRRADNAAQRAQFLIHDLQAYSEITTAGVQTFTACRLEAVLKGALENLQVAIEKSRAVITHDPLPVVEGNEAQLLRLFQNIIANAIKFSDKECPLIHVGVHDQGPEWRLSFRDNGIGIAPEHIELLFTIFTHLHPRNQYPGTGIGLAICKKIVERQGGRIWAESEVGKGSTFFISIPKRK